MVIHEKKILCGVNVHNTHTHTHKSLLDISCDKINLYMVENYFDALKLQTEQIGNGRQKRKLYVFWNQISILAEGLQHIQSESKKKTSKGNSSIHYTIGQIKNIIYIKPIQEHTIKEAIRPGHQCDCIRVFIYYLSHGCFLMFLCFYFGSCLSFDLSVW